MKRTSIIFLLVFYASCASKKETDKAIATLPPFDVLLIDSTTLLNSKQIPTGNPIVLMYFSPECEHCQKETKEIIHNIDRLKDVRLFFVTPLSHTELVTFYKHYQLSHYKNIVAATDYNYSFYNAFKPTDVPYWAIYNDRKELVRTIKGEVPMTELIDVIEE